MKSVFSAEGRRAAESVIGRNPLFAFDFDGTLCPIMPRPEDVSVSPEMTETLKKITFFAPVAIVTGRKIDDLKKYISFNPRFMIGNHGAEDPAGILNATFDHVRWSLIREEIYAARSVLEAFGASIEDKGMSLALHYRRAPYPKRAYEAILDILQNCEGQLRWFGGKTVVNVVPENAPDKYDAVAALVKYLNAGAAVFAGDDENDEPVFENAPPNWLTVRVGDGARPSKAKFFARDPQEIERFLRQIAVFYQEKRQ